MRIHHLREYERRELDLDPATVRYLAAHHRRHLTMDPLDGSRRWEVRPESYVGTIRAGDEVFHIRPKVPLQNLLAMMDIEIPSEVWRRQIALMADDPDLLSVMARAFCLACEETTRRGLRRAYVPREELLVSPRGRIDVMAMARRPGTSTPVACRFDEHTADTSLNRLLREAIEMARRVRGVGPEWQRRLLIQAAHLESVSQPQPGESFDWAKTWQPGPMDLHYDPAVTLAYLLLSGTSLRNSAGSSTANTFLLNMNDLFEKWVAKRLGEQCPELRLEIHDTSSLDIGHAVTMEPDITLWRHDRVIAVLDCKYKLLSTTGTGQSGDYYQALAYATAYNLDDAWLVYARHPGDPEPTATVHVRNTGVRLHTFGLDMSGPISGVIEQLRELGRLAARGRVKTVMPPRFEPSR